ncbi:MAG TPA: alkaline phosphatase family protein [Rhizobiaceae bacterium]|nr:alkaline phosphatase family protein [Rhizobiaceae bacterium]
MGKVKNILWIMCDQLRWDYLSCAGHPHLETPNIDRLAARGVRFDRAYVQSTICGPSRMSAYTGRYVRTHGSTWNGVPLKVGEPTLGDHLRELGVRCVLAGKTHMKADAEGLARLGIDPDSIIGVLQSECGFEPFERDDGLHPDGPYDPDPDYDTYLRNLGYNSDNPWQDWANSAAGEDGEVLDGSLLIHADKAARIPEEHSETPYMTRRAMDFMRAAKTDGRPWLLHLSYIKPHWPYIVPAPYHDMYGAKDVQPPVRSEDERANAHPLYAAYMEERFSKTFARDEVRERVIPAYMGLIKQIDDQLGKLFAFMDDEGLTDETMIVFTSDHGDYVGDHWMGEKYLFHDPSARVPLIIVDPSPEAETTRGTVSDALVEMIDLVPTFVDALGGAAKPNVLEGRSLLPLLHGARPATWREAVFSEYDFAFDPVRVKLGTPVSDSRMTMVFDGRWKYVHIPGFRPMLHDLQNDPQELVDLGSDPAFEKERVRLHELMFDWARRPATRTTKSDAAITKDDDVALLFDQSAPAGILIGFWDEAEVEADRKAREEALRNRKPSS